MGFPTIVCSDLPGLINKVIEKRQRERDSVRIKISIDGGGGFLKIQACLFNIDDPIQKMSGALSKTFLESGVRKVFIIGLVPDVSEVYLNVKRLQMNCGVENLRNYTLATDLKMCKLLLGMINHSSCHPCAWCDITKDALHKERSQHTISSLMNFFWVFLESGNEKPKAKKFGNVIHLPTLSFSYSHHLNYISLLDLLTKCMQPLNHCALCIFKIEDYHGGTFAGNESRKLLKIINRLETLSPPSSYMKIINAFKSFNQLASSCCGSELHPDFEDKIPTFAKE